PVVLRAQIDHRAYTSFLTPSLSLSIATLRVVDKSQPRNGEGVFAVLVAMLLTSQANVPLGYRSRFCVFALAVELADLSSQIGELITTLRSGMHGAADCQQRHQYC